MDERRRLLRSAACYGAAVALAATLGACGGGGGTGAQDAVPPPADETNAAALLKADEVLAIMQSSARAQSQPVAVAVSDRRGVVLGVATNFGVDEATYRSQCLTGCPSRDFALASDSDCVVIDRAVQLARTAAFFSANETPLTSRSVRFLSGEHFPPHIHDTGAAALFGIENTNRGCSFDTAPIAGSDLPPRAPSLQSILDPSLRCQSSSSGADTCGCSTGIATLPGAVPIYRGGVMVGGVGVAVRGVSAPFDPVAAHDAPDTILRRDDTDPAWAVGEFAARAFVGDDTSLPRVQTQGLEGLCTPGNGVVPPACCASGGNCDLDFLPHPLPAGTDPVIFVDGIEIPEIDLDPQVNGVGAGAPLTTPLIVDASASTEVVHSGWLVPAHAAGTNGGPLAAGDVESIIDAGIAEAETIRAAIRLPLQQRSAMVLAVTDLNGELLGAYRMPDATVFSIDVAVAKARNVTYFSSETIAPIDTRNCPGPSIADCGESFFPVDGNSSTAMTNRTIGFCAQPFFPPGIDGTGSSPDFNGGPLRRVFIEDSANPCGNAGQTANGRQDGIVFFPGSAPLYRDGVLVGGLGVSGDGVEQDDIVTFAGTQAGPGFDAPAALRADQIQIGDVRLPYLKFNRQPDE
ncbi:MAG TPA: heme-binding protein [Candidatus Binatia bacterium]|jgi:uncharacterized protein GlcG (DUF336 family)